MPPMTYGVTPIFRIGQIYETNEHGIEWEVVALSRLGTYLVCKDRADGEQQGFNRKWLIENCHEVKLDYITLLKDEAIRTYQEMIETFTKEELKEAISYNKSCLEEEEYEGQGIIPACGNSGCPQCNTMSIKEFNRYQLPPVIHYNIVRTEQGDVSFEDSVKREFESCNCVAGEKVCLYHKREVKKMYEDAQACKHKWTHYQGLVESFTFCETCGEKK